MKSRVSPNKWYIFRMFVTVVPYIHTWVKQFWFEEPSCCFFALCIHELPDIVMVDGGFLHL